MKPAMAAAVGLLACGAIQACRDSNAEAGPSLSVPDSLATGQFSVPAGRVAWTYDLTDPVYARPAVDDSIVVVGNYEGIVASLDRATGRQLWRFEAAVPLEAPPVLAGDHAVVASTAGTLFAIDRAGGQERWRFTADAGFYAAPLILDATVLVGSNDGVLHAIAAETGEELWRYVAGGGIESSVVRGDRGGLLYFGCKDSYLYAIHPRATGEAWKFKGEEAFVTTPVLAGDVLYAADYGGTVYAIRATTGEEIWRHPTGGAVKFAPALGEGLLFVVVSEKELSAIDTRSGRPRWRLTHESGLRAPLFTAGKVLVGSAEGVLFALDGATGSLLWSFRADGELFGAPAAVANTLYVSTLGGKLHALELAEGNGTRARSQAVAPAEPR
jgi:outer membrane protein assembly factor BamB